MYLEMLTTCSWDEGSVNFIVNNSSGGYYAVRPVDCPAICVEGQSTGAAAGMPPRAGRVQGGTCTRYPVAAATFFLFLLAAARSSDCPAIKNAP